MLAFSLWALPLGEQNITDVTQNQQKHCSNWAWAESQTVLVAITASAGLFIYCRWSSRKQILCKNNSGQTTAAASGTRSKPVMLSPPYPNFSMEPLVQCQGFCCCEHERGTASLCRENQSCCSQGFTHRKTQIQWNCDYGQLLSKTSPERRKIKQKENL